MSPASEALKVEETSQNTEAMGQIGREPPPNVLS